MLQFDALMIAIMISIVSFQTLDFQKQLNAYRARERETYKNSVLLNEGLYDYNEDIVYDEKTNAYNTYDYRTVLNSYAIQSYVMPCDTLIFGTKYLKKQTAADESAKTVFSQLKMTGNPNLNDRFILVRENKNMHWYYINSNARDSLNIYGNKVKYIQTVPGYYSGTDYSLEKFNIGDSSRFDLVIR